MKAVKTALPFMISFLLAILRSPAAIPPGERTTGRTGYEADRAPQPFCMLWREHSAALARNETADEPSAAHSYTD
jgi:hypothetical protein